MKLSITAKFKVVPHLDVHNNTLRYRCVFCHFRSGDTTIFGDHLSSHFDELDYKCDICGYVATGKGPLNKHLDTHNDIKYKCTLCPKICPTRDAHNQHVSKKHNIHKDIGDYRIEIKPKITEKDMIEMFPDRNKK